MLKLVTWDLKDDYGYHAEILNGPFVKTAATYQGEYSPDIVKAIGSLDKKPGHTYLLINAMGAGEFYGPNKNSDYFPEKVLRDYHKTFEALAYVYKHHVNKDPQRSYGKVLYSFYNDKMHRVELIVEVANEKAPDIIEKISKGEHVSVSMGCFKDPSTPIRLANLITKPIAEIEIGDEVLTHTGQVKKVTELHNRDYIGTVYTINPVGKFREPIQATKEHPWLVIEPEKFYKKVGWVRQQRDVARKLTLKDAIWKTSEELTGEEFLVMPKPKFQEISISQEKAKLLGWYLAEGHTHTKDNGVEFSVNKEDQIVKEIDSVCNILGYPQPNYVTRANTDKSYSITIYSKALKEDCLKYCGKYSHKKELHSEIFGWSEEAKLAFLGAMISGDGFFHEGQTYISSCNKELIEQLQWLALSIGLNTTIGKNKHQAGKGFSAQDTVEWFLRFRNTANSKLSKYAEKIPNRASQGFGGKGGPYLYEDFALVKIESIELEEFDGPVYNFEVEEDNSYVVDTWAVHNCKVPWDECNICGNRAKTREEYCSHLQRGVAGHIQADGKRPYAINWQPKFFDISFVTIPADPTASVMAKVAALHGKPTGSHIINGIEAMDNLLKAAKVKHADIDKVIDGEVVAVSEDPKGLIPASQPEIPLDEIKNLTTENPLSKILSTLLALRIMPKMQDFQRLVLYSTGQGALSDECDRCKYLFPVSPDVTPIMPADVDLNYMDPMLARRMAHLMPQRSLSKPLVIIRIIEKIAEAAPAQQAEMATHNKVKKRITKYLTPQQDQLRYSVETEAEAFGQTPKLAGLFGGNSAPAEPTPPTTVTRNPFFAITGLGALYIGFQRLMNLGTSKDLPKLERTMIQNPWLLPILAGAAGLATVAMQPATPPMFAKTSELHRPMPKYRLGGISTILAGAVPAYYYAGLQEAKVQRGEQIGQVQDWVRRHPFLTSLAGMATVRGGLAALNKHASLTDVVTRLDEDTLNKLYFDLTS